MKKLINRLVWSIILYSNNKKSITKSSFNKVNSDSFTSHSAWKTALDLMIAGVKITDDKNQNKMLAYNSRNQIVGEWYRSKKEGVVFYKTL